jgi:hypothetical protein
LRTRPLVLNSFGKFWIWGWGTSFWIILWYLAQDIRFVIIEKIFRLLVLKNWKFEFNAQATSFWMISRI